ncbi:MAG: M67 family metallopeptidase [Deltaproteobacteria bacterium]|nr:M67 family metallopeptidase [Deltaproteobacteria bacterium]
MIEIEARVVDAMREHAVEGFPEEVCGVVFATPGGQILRRLRNIQNELHAKDPEQHPRTAATAYHMDSRELFEIEKQAREPGWRVLVFYHSHPQHDAYFSPTDRAQASYTDPVDGSRGPTYPGTTWVVVSVYDRVVRDVRAYAWDDEVRDFGETSFAVARRG